MTDRFHSLTVVLEKDIRDDDAEWIIAHLKMLRGVASVAGNVSNPTDFVAQERAKLEYRKKLLAALD